MNHFHVTDSNKKAWNEFFFTKTKKRNSFKAINRTVPFAQGEAVRESDAD